MARVLMFTSKTGGGHVSLAESVSDILAGDTVEIVDPQPSFIHWHYRFASRHALWLWAAEYRYTDRPDRALTMHRRFGWACGNAIANLLAAWRPDVIVSTYPFFTWAVNEACETIGIRAPMAALLSDANRVHETWLTDKRIAAVLCPTRETHVQCLESGFAAARVHLSGWPVRRQFLAIQRGTRDRIHGQLGLDPAAFTVFMQGGGEGSARFARTTEALLSLGRVQIIFAAGSNRAAAEKLANVPRVRVLPYTREIAPFMAAADVVVGKAGPNTLMEAVMLGRPFVATTFIPGQEEGNLEFIERHGLGWTALAQDDQLRLVDKLARNPAMLAGRQNRVAEYREWNSRALDRVPGILASIKG
jgi:UDP-N-acetylglucosamine:LPS N-acetylglucosamine transferase